jgi:hypothetical protein
VNFASLDSNSLALNDAGQLAFTAQLTDNSSSLWATDVAGSLHLIARKGGQLEVAPGDFRTVNALAFAGGAGTSDGRRLGFNNSGQLAFSANFTDNSTGIFVSNAVAHLPGDFNHDGAVDSVDLAQWQGDFGVNNDSDADHDNDSDGADFLAWQRQFNGAATAAATIDAVPEPSSLVCLRLAALGLAVGLHRSAAVKNHNWPRST